MEPKKQLNLVQITAPGLNKSNYGEQLDQQFQNIDSNFKKIVGTDFLKGNTGDSVQLIEVEFNEGGRKSLGLYLNNEELTDGSLYEKIKQTILTALTKYVNGTIDENNINIKSQLINVGKLTWKDWLKRSNKITFLYKTNDFGKKNIISSLQYTFMDARFNNIQYNNISSYEGAVDLSCIIFLGDTDGKLSFSRINTFPTIYYDTNMESADSTEYNRYGTFCWRINGNDTGIPAVGPRGKTGKDNKIYVVRVDKNTDASNECVIKEVLYVSDTETYFMPIDEFVKQDVHFDEGVFVLAIKEFERVSEYVSEDDSSTRPPVSDGTHMWASPLIVETTVINGQEIKIYKAYCDASNSILNTYEAQSILNAMCSMYDSSVFHGLVIPISGPETNPYTQETEQTAHMIYALRPEVINGKEYNEYVNLVIAPMDNIHNKPTARNYGDAGTYNDLDLKTSITFLYDTTRIGNKLQVDGDVNIDDDLNVEGTSILRGGLISYGNAEFDSAVFKNDGVFKKLVVGGNLSNAYNFEFLTQDNNAEDVFSIFVGNEGTSRIRQYYQNNDINLKQGGRLRIYGGTVTNNIADSSGSITTSTVDNEIITIDFPEADATADPDAFQGLDDIKISLYKNTEIFGDLDVGGYLEAMSMTVEQQLNVGGHIKAYNVILDNDMQSNGFVISQKGLITNGQLKVAGNSSLGGGLLTVKVDDEDPDENYIDVAGDSYFTGAINIGKRKTGGGGVGSLSDDPLGGLTGSNSQDYTGEDSLHDGIKIYPDKKIEDLTKNFELTREFKNEGAWGAIVNYGAEERNWWGPYKDLWIDNKEYDGFKHAHKITKKNGITSLFSNNKFKDNVTHLPDRWWQLHRLWSWPLSAPIDRWVDLNEFSMNGEWTQTVWDRAGNDNVDEYKLKFDKDLSAVFSVSGRNLYNRPWLKKASWAIPRWRRARMVVNIITTYGSSNDNQDTHHTENIVDTGWRWIDWDLFNNWNTNEYDEDKVNKSNKPNSKWGDTVIGAFTVSPNRYEYSIDGTNLKKIKIFVGVYFDFYRTQTYKENQVYKTWRSAKILGILPSSRSANGTVEYKLVDRWFNHSGTTQDVPLDDSNDPLGRFNKLLYNGKFDDVGVVYLPQTKLTKATKEQIINATTGEFSNNTFDWGDFGKDAKDKMDIYLYGNQPKFIPIINVESINVSSNFTGGNIHICPDGILLVSPSDKSSASGDDLNFAYLEVGKSGQPPTINAVTTTEGTTKKASISLYNLITKSGGAVSDWERPK